MTFRYSHEERERLLSLLPPSNDAWGHIWTIGEVEKAAVTMIISVAHSSRLPDRDTLKNRRLEKLKAVQTVLAMLDLSGQLQRFKDLDRSADEEGIPRLDHVSMLAKCLLSDRLSSVDFTDHLALIALDRLARDLQEPSMEEDTRIDRGNDYSHRNRFIIEVHRIWTRCSGVSSISDDAKSMEFILEACNPAFSHADLKPIGARMIREIINGNRALEEAGKNQGH